MLYAIFGYVVCTIEENSRCWPRNRRDQCMSIPYVAADKCNEMLTSELHALLCRRRFLWTRRVFRKIFFDLFMFSRMSRRCVHQHRASRDTKHIVQFFFFAEQNYCIDIAPTEWTKTPRLLCCFVSDRRQCVMLSVDTFICISVEKSAKIFHLTMEHRNRRLYKKQHSECVVITVVNNARTVGRTCNTLNRNASDCTLVLASAYCFSQNAAFTRIRRIMFT